MIPDILINLDKEKIEFKNEKLYKQLKQSLTVSEKKMLSNLNKETCIGVNDYELEWSQSDIEFEK